MASKDKSGFIIPPEVSDKRKCIQFWIPDDVYDRGAFWGAMFELTYSWNWTAVDGGSPRAMADMWRQIWQDAYERSNGMNCCDDQPVIKRFNPDTGRAEISYTDGNTWVDDPADPQNSVQLLAPPVHEGSTSTKCDAATNASEHVNELIASTSTNIGTAGDVFSLAVAVAEAALALFLILISAGTLTPAVTLVATSIWAAATAAFALGKDAFDAYWTEDKKDAILCQIYCNIGENGQFSDAQYQSFRAGVKGQLPASPALDIVMTAINAGGARGLSQMASYGNAALADCSSCTACLTCPEKFSLYYSIGANPVRGDGWIEIDSVESGLSGGQSVAITTNNANECCYLLKTETPTGTPIALYNAMRACGQPIPAFGEGFGLNNQNCTVAFNTLLLYNNSHTPFRVRIFLSDTPCVI